MALLPQSDTNHPPLWTLIRDIAVLQVKLIVDGVRDLILVPASLIAGIVSLAKTKDGQPGTEFYRLVSVGSQSERWINLFGALKNAPADLAEELHFGEVESFVVDEYKRGGVTAQARDRLEKAIEAMRRRRNKDENV